MQLPASLACFVAQHDGVVLSRSSWCKARDCCLCLTSPLQLISGLSSNWSAVAVRLAHLPDTLFQMLLASVRH